MAWDGFDYLISFGSFQSVSVIGASWKWIPNVPEGEEGGLSQQLIPSSLWTRGLLLQPGGSPRAQDPQLLFSLQPRSLHYLLQAMRYSQTRQGLFRLTLRKGVLAVYRVPISLKPTKSISQSSNNSWLDSNWASGTLRSQIMSPVETGSEGLEVFLTDFYITAHEGMDRIPSQTRQTSWPRSCNCFMSEVEIKAMDVYYTTVYFFHS